MPRVTHDANRQNTGVVSAAPSLSTAQRGANVFHLLEFIGEAGKTCEQIGKWLGTEHKAQAIIRGSNRIKGLLADNIVYRGTQIKGEYGKEDHALYHLTERGKEMRDKKTVIASPKDKETLAASSARVV